MFSPDDFRNDPYTAGLNQMGHVVFGAALAVVFGWVIAALAFVAWEAVQVRYMGARKHDYYQDCFFWCVGVYVAGGEFLSLVALLSGGFWMGVTWLYQKLQ
jgi:hypothetical protein